MNEFEIGEKVVNDSELLEFALDKLGISKEELEEEYEEKQISENISKRCKDFENYCNDRCCDDCDVYKFQKRNNMSGLGTRDCMLIYEYLFKK